jgi:CheY-like chemotaxis protein
MSQQSSCTEPLAYILIVESDKDLRESALHRINVPNCAIDVARDENEAVHKAPQHRPQLIIVKLHEALDIDPQNPPTTSRASLICRRARLSRAVRLVPHSDVAITIRLYLPNSRPLSSHSEVGRTISHPEQVILIKAKFKAQAWRNEWYAYSGSQRGTDFLSDHIPYWLGWMPNRPYPQSPESLLSPWKRMDETFLN